MGGITMNLICKLFGHKQPYCESGCASHGWCSRCNYYYEKRTDMWYSKGYMQDREIKKKAGYMMKKLTEKYPENKLNAFLNGGKNE